MAGGQKVELDFACYVRMRLRHIGMSQAQLARSTGISRPALVKLLNGKTRAPRLETTHAMARALGVSPSHLFRLLTGDPGEPFGGSGREPAPRNAAEVIDVTIPGGMPVASGARFEKVWDVRNVGTAEWHGHRLRCIDQALAASFDRDLQAQYFLRPDSTDIAVPYAAPGDVVRLSQWFTAPRLPIACVSMWRMFGEFGPGDAHPFATLNVVVLVNGAAG